MIDLISLLKGTRECAMERIPRSRPQDWQPGLTIVVPIYQNVKDLIVYALVPLPDMFETEDDK